MIREIVRDPLFLQQKSEPATIADRDVVQDLLDTIQANRQHCVGMAANMIGSRKTILVAQLGKRYQILINPEITAHAAQCYEAEEGCLSLNGTRSAKRYSLITVRYLDQNFRQRTGTFRGFEAQIIQHEMDHFQGILI